MIEDDLHIDAARKKFIKSSDFEEGVAPQIPETFGKFKILGLIGQGGAGDVYLAVDTTLQREVALKVLTRLSPHDLERFSREAQITAKLDHPNIVKIHEIGQVNNLHYICIQYVKGETLDEKRMQINDALKAIHKVALALYYAHSIEVIHRDIKPSNIIIDDQSNVHLMDFGIAKQVDIKGPTISYAGMVIGTPAFMSPEQGSGDLKRIDKLSDIYSLGATLYFLLTGSEPHKGKNTVEVINDVINEDPEEPRRITANIPREVESIVLKAMHRRKENRYQSSKEFADDIQRFLSGEPVLARPPSLTTRIAKRMRKSKPAIIALFFVISIAAAFFILRAYLHKRDRAYSLVDEGNLILESVKTKFYNKESNIDEIEKNLKAALERFDESIKLFPLARSYYYKAKVYRGFHDYEKAIENLNKATELEPNFAIASLEKARIYFEMYMDNLYFYAKEEQIRQEADELKQKGLQTLQRITDSKLFDPESKIMTGLLDGIKLIFDGKIDEAINSLRRLYDEHKREEIYIWIGMAYFHKFETNNAIDYFRKALDIRPLYPEAYFYLANAYAFKKDYIKSKENYDEAIRINRSFTLAYLNRAAACINLQDYHGAIRDATEAIKIKPGYYRLYLVRGTAYFQMKEYDRALENFTQCLNLKKDCYDALVNRASALSINGNNDGAINDYSTAIKINPENFFSYFKRAYVFIKKEDFDSALADLNKAIDLNDQFPDLYFIRGKIYYEKNQDKLALKDFEKCLDLKPDSSSQVKPYIDSIKQRSKPDH